MLPHAPPRDRRSYDRYFRAPIRFDAEWTAVAFPARWLSHRVTGADPSLLGPLQQSVDALAARHGNDLIMRARRAHHVLMMQGKGSMSSVADLMGMHRRTLNRRLALSGTSMSEQLEEVKSHIARQLVADTTMSMIEIAATLNTRTPRPSRAPSADGRACRLPNGANGSVSRTDPSRSPAPPTIDGRNVIL